MTTAQLNNTVAFQYKSSCNGEVFFDSATDREDPPKIKLGEGRVMPELEQCLVGMSEGETKTVTVPPENAYGEYRDEMVVIVDKSELPHDIIPVEGMMMQGLTDGDLRMNVTIAKVDGDKITLDGNHRLAGKPIEFEVKLLMIEK